MGRLTFPWLLDELKLGFGFLEESFFVGEGATGFFDEFLWRLRDVVRALETFFESDDLLAHLEDVVLEVGFVLVVNILRDLDINVVVVNSQMETSSVLGIDFWYAR